MTADMIRASLLARATVTPRAGLREKRGQPIARSAPFRLPATRNNEVAPPPSLAAIAPPRTRPVALFADGAGLLFAAAGILPRRRSERGGKVASCPMGARLPTECFSPYIRSERMPYCDSSDPDFRHKG
jgi:hypothetical protein